MSSKSRLDNNKAIKIEKEASSKPARVIFKSSLGALVGLVLSLLVIELIFSSSISTLVSYIPVLGIVIGLFGGLVFSRLEK